MSIEVTKLCRTCLTLDGILLSIYDSKGSNGSGCIADMLREIINCEFKKTDGLPEEVCLSCISEINRCYSFKIKCDNADRTLRQLLNIHDEPEQATNTKINTEKQLKSTTELNHVPTLYDEGKKKSTKRKKFNGVFQDKNTKESYSLTMVENNSILSVQPENETSFFSVHTKAENELIEDHDKNHEIIEDEQNSGDYSIIFTKFVQETEEAQIVDKQGAIEKKEKSAALFKCSAKSSKLESKCSMCPMSFVHNRNLIKHMGKIHNATEVSIISKETLEPNHQEELEYIENRDKEQYDLRLIEVEEDTTKHESQPMNTNIEDQIKELRCPRCKALFAIHSSLNIHIKMNKCTRPQFSCADCQKVFISVISLKEHMKTHTSLCRICGQNFNNKNELAQHIADHEGVNPKHQCSSCKKVFAMRSTLNDHMRIHTGEKPFVCDLCGKAFNQNANLKQHVMRHNKTKPFKCDQCHRSFVSKGELYAHLRSHNGEQPFRCDSCPSAFTTSSSLLKHKRIHTGERPYSCDFCPMRFTALNTLKNHRRTHTGEKPYKCKFCSRAFAQKSDCTIHMRTHTGERRYSCNICTMKFQQSGTLRTHMKIHKSKTSRLYEKVEKQEILCPREMENIAIEEHVQTSNTVAVSEEVMDICQEELLDFNIEDCGSDNSVYSRE